MSQASAAMPPPAVLAVLNPCMRGLVRTPLGRVVPFGVLTFTGRRSGRTFRVPVGVHDVRGVPHVFSPAPWRANFGTDTPVTVTHRGCTTAMLGTLVRDPDQVAEAFNVVLAGGTPPRAIGITDPGGGVTPDDMRRLGRAMIVLRPALPQAITDRADGSSSTTAG
jgi:hypothetical protein